MANEVKPLNTIRSRKCTSCEQRIKPKQTVLAIWRHRSPRNDIEERIHGDEVPLATYYYCEKCAALHEFITAMNRCYSLGDNLEKELEEAGETK